MNSHYLRQILIEHLARAQSKVPKLSKRGFAKKIGISHGALIEIISGKRNISVPMAQRICTALGVSSAERDLVLKSAFQFEEMSAKEKIMYGDQFEMMSSWQHIAILSLLNLRGFSGKTEAIAGRLGLNIPQVLRLLNCLERLSLVEERDQRWRCLPGIAQTTTDEVASAAIKKSHRGFLGLATQKLDQVSLDKRDFTTITMGINPKKISQAKKLIRKFQDDMAALLEDDKASEVYILGTQLIPVTMESV